MRSPMRLVLHMWKVAMPEAPLLLPAVLPTLLPLMQQLQSCGRLLLLLPQRSWRLQAAGSTASTEAAPSDDGAENINEAVFQFHEDASNLVFMLHVLAAEQVGAAASQQISSMLQQPPVQQLLLQLLTTCAVMLHQDHTAHQQQHGAADQGSSSSSSSSASRGRATTTEAAKWPPKVHADLLPIPALHIAWLTSLPGGQAYLDGAAAVVAQQPTEVQRQRFCWWQAGKNLIALCSALEDSFLPGSEPLRRDAHVLSANAVQLVLELQLLAAGAVQRLREHPQSTAEADADFLRDWTSQVLFWSNTLLQYQTRAILQAGSSCLPPEVLQQAGLQLLQALAAPVQQLQLSSTSSPDARLQHLLLTQQGIPEQLYILRAADSGLEAAQDRCELWRVRAALPLCMPSPCLPQ
jgi:hypothetical protein